MPLIQTQIKKNREAVTIKLDKTIIDQLKSYAEFIDSTQEYVVNEALALTFKRDKEFQKWLESSAKGVGNAETC